MSNLTPAQKDMMKQVIATMEIEDMEIDEQGYENLYSIITGEKAEEQVIADIIERYSHGQ